MAMASLPSLSRLGLDARPAAPTDVIVSLEQTDVDALNEAEEVCPITQEEFEAGQGQDSENPTFQVVVPNTQGTVVRYYDGRALYHWVARLEAEGEDPTDPIDRHILEDGDVVQLHARFALDLSEDEDVDARATVVREGVIGPCPIVERRYRAFTYPDSNRRRRAWVRYYEGPARAERMVRDVYAGPNGQTVVYEGAQGSEHKVSRTFSATGFVQHYVGPQGQERLVSISTPDGVVGHYAGAKGEERKTHETRPDGSITYCKGPINQERQLRKIMANGETEFYEGAFGHEKIVSVQKTNGQVWYYIGEKGSERLTRVEDSVAGTIQYYRGRKGREVPVGSSVRMRNEGSLRPRRTLQRRRTTPF